MGVTNGLLLQIGLMVDFLQVLLTPTHLAIVMEYAAGGELFERICNAGRFSEDEVMRQNSLEKNYAQKNMITLTLYWNELLYIS